MTKEDLKTGMQIHFNEGNSGVVLLNTQHGDLVIGKQVWFMIQRHPFELSKWTAHKGVKFVSQPSDPIYYVSECSDNKIWENKPVEEMTLSQVCKELGKTIKIIEG